jgi:hypothetical protein
MVAFSGPLAMERCKSRQARKGATVADVSCAGVWLEEVITTIDQHPDSVGADLSVCPGTQG